jgi:hypothetical protein
MVAKLYAGSDKSREDASKIDRIRVAITGASSVSPELRAETPTVLATEGDWLLLSPLGTRFTATTFKLRHTEMLLRLLQSAHQANIIHRDVRFAKKNLLSNDQVLLNDWGVLPQKVALVSSYRGVRSHFVTRTWLMLLEMCQNQSMIYIPWLYPLHTYSYLDCPTISAH